MIYRRGREVRDKVKFNNVKRQYILARNPGYNEGLLEDKNQE